MDESFIGSEGCCLRYCGQELTVHSFTCGCLGMSTSIRIRELRSKAKVVLGWASRSSSRFLATMPYGNKWVDYKKSGGADSRQSPSRAGVQAHGEFVEENKTIMIAEGVVASPARTALDLGCW